MINNLGTIIQVKNGDDAGLNRGCLMPPPPQHNPVSIFSGANCGNTTNNVNIINSGNQTNVEGNDIGSGFGSLLGGVGKFLSGALNTIGSIGGGVLKLVGGLFGLGG